MRKRVLSLITIVLLGIGVCSAETTLVILLTDSTEVRYSLSQQPVMHFDYSTISLTCTGGAAGGWSFSSVDSWHFEDPQGPNALPETENTKMLIRIDDHRLTVTGAGSNSAAVYDVAGRLITTAADSEGDALSIGLNGLPQGTYLLQVGDNTVKFMIR